MSIARRAHLVLAWLLVAGIVVQVFLAGLGVFDDPAFFLTHATWGYTLEALPFLMFVLAAIGRLGRRQVVFGLGIFGMFLLQSVFVVLRVDLPMVAALHPVNGFAILFVSIVAAREAWAARSSAAITTSTPRLEAAAAGDGR